MQIDGNTPLWIAARVLLLDRGDDFIRCMEKVQATFDAEDIHDLRVSSRRMREGLTLFEPCYPPSGIATTVRKVKCVTRLLGEIRNTDEAIRFFSTLAEELGEPCQGDLETLLSLFRKNRKKGIKGLKRGLSEIDNASLWDIYRRTVNSPALFKPPAHGVDLLAPLSGFSRNALDERLADVVKLVPDARRPGAVEAQHRLRIAVKHYRYRVEILSFLVKGNYDALHDSLKRYQEVLGTMHDLDVFAAMPGEEGLPYQVAEVVSASITAKREKLFSEFCAMLETAPLEMIGEKVRASL
ncbi:MAG: domain containing protein [Geobacteraceae bacterium]|nr:domain containing protein [Geobacteraceae bacterium]